MKGLVNGFVSPVDDRVILVDEADREIGFEEKMATHYKGLLHRAFSVFVFNDAGEMLLQQRHPMKYHSGGLWSNTCCSHPRPGESPIQAATRRLKEEMGFDCELHKVFSFVYRVQLTDDLYEHEYDHVLVGRYNGALAPDRKEVLSWRWMNPETLRRDVAEKPERYTHWFRMVYERVLDEIHRGRK